MESNDAQASGQAIHPRRCGAAPTAVAGGPYSVDEGSTIQLDGTASSDPENAILTYAWSPGTRLDDTTVATPVYDAVDDTIDAIDLMVSDVGGDVTPATALTDTDSTTVTVNNVAPSVTAVGDSIEEGDVATVSATFTDPGSLDTHTASIDWDDGTPPQAVTPLQLASGVTHSYGDNGAFQVTVTVTDDDLGAGMDTATVTVGNLDPSVTLDLSDQIAFPGGDYFVVGAGDPLPLSADGTDPGSDDLTFTWTSGDVTTYFNDPTDVPDPLPSSLGNYPFAAADGVDAVDPLPGVQLVMLTLSDDDGGTDTADAMAIVTGTATDTQGSGWWKHQYSANGAPHIDQATAAAYLDIADAVSSVFSEAVAASTAEEAHSVLSPSGNDARARATAALLVAWLEFLVSERSDLVEWAGRLDTMGVEHSGVKAFDYKPNSMLTFRDPDNIQLEFFWRAPSTSAG